VFDILIKNGFIIDGTGAPGRRGAVAVTGAAIAAVDTLKSLPARDVIDARGCCVCPGFIDIHSHSDFNILVDPPGQGKIQQGVTTEVCGNCGLSAAPLLGMARQQRAPGLKHLGIDITWSTLDEFAHVAAARPLLSNIAPLVGHGNIRGSVMGYDDREPTREEMKGMASLLTQEMAAGAWGLSTGLIYPPGVFAHQDELVMLAEIAGRCGGIYTSHIRNEGDRVVAALEEALNIGRRAGIPVQISHLKTMEKRNWHKLRDVFQVIEKAAEEGITVGADRYPYTAGSTGLDAVLPAWACRGGAAAELERLGSAIQRDKIYAGILQNKPEQELAQEIVISRVITEKNKSLEGKNLGQCAEIKSMSIQDTLFELLIEEALDVDALFFSMSENNLTEILSREYVMVGSDASVWDITGVLGRGKPHPRAFGTFPRILQKYVSEQKILSLEQAVHKMTAKPARAIGLPDRGMLRKGYKADIVIFDRKNLRDNATYAQPHRYPDGIVRVMVNGTWAVHDGRLAGAYPGRLLLKT